MIKQDKTVYKNYVTKISKRMNKLLTCIPNLPESNPLKQDIEKTHMQLSAKIALLEVKLTKSIGIIPQDDWEKYQREIDTLYTELETKINNTIVILQNKQNNRVQ